MAEHTTIVDRIRTLANAQGYSLTTLEVKLILGNGTISRWNKSSPNTDKLAKVADFFNVSIDYLLGRANEATAEDDERDVLDEVDVAFYGDFKELNEDEKETVRDMVRLMRQRKEKRSQ